MSVPVYKFIVVGPSGVGKSCILFQYIEHSFHPGHDLTIGVEFYTKTLELSGRDGASKEHAKLQIWDTAGQECFRAVTTNYYRGASGALLVYDVSQRRSFEQMTSWLQDIRKLCLPDVAVSLIANKADMAGRAVSHEEGEAFAKANQIKFFVETSAKDPSSIDQAFLGLAQHVHSSGVAPSSMSPLSPKLQRLGTDVRGSAAQENKPCCFK